jgi:DNA-binding transcriptional MerR regulator
MKKFYYTIGEVSNLLDIKPYVIRYWETEFHQLKPRKENGRNRQFTEEHIELLKRIKDMLYNQKFTIDGARQKLKQIKKTPEAVQMELDLFDNPTPLQTSTTAKAKKVRRTLDADKLMILTALRDLQKQAAQMVKTLKTIIQEQ